MIHAKKQKSVIHPHEKKWAIKMSSKGTQMFDLVDEDFEATMINMLKEPKEIITKVINQDLTTYEYQHMNNGSIKG